MEAGTRQGLGFACADGCFILCCFSDLLFTEPDALRHGLALPTFVVLSSFTGHSLYTLKWVVLSSVKQLDFKEMALIGICIKRCSMDLGPQGTYHLLKSPPEEGGTLWA